MESKVDIPVCGNVSPQKQRRKRQKLLVELLLDYAQNSTIHGPRYMTEPGVSLFEKIFWGITFMISVVLCITQIRDAYRKWDESPIIVSLNEDIVPIGMVPFPSVTICPRQKIMSSRFNYTSILEKVIINNGTTDYKRYIDEASAQKFGDLNLLCGRDQYLFTDRLNSNSSTIDNILEVSLKQEEMIESCLWLHQRSGDGGGVGESCKDLFTKVLTKDGVCYNFNSLSAEETFRYDSIQRDYSYMDASTKSKKWTLETNYIDADTTAYPWRGMTYGIEPDLQIILKSHVNESDILCDAGNKGHRIYLQHPTDFPQASLSSYAALPNQVTSLAVKLNMITTSPNLQGSPLHVRKCYFPGERRLRYFKIYTLNNCQLECQTNYTFNECGCVWTCMPHSDSYSICTARKTECVMRSIVELGKKELEAKINPAIETGCRCYPACEYIDYDAEISITDFNSHKEAHAMRDIYIRNGLDDPFPSLSQDIADETKVTYSLLCIFFQKPSFVSMRRSELHGRTEFLSNCGGLLGLFLGFSFLSLMEIIYYITIRLCCFLKRDIEAEKKNGDGHTE